MSSRSQAEPQKERVKWLVTLEDGEYAANPSITLARGSPIRDGAWYNDCHRIFPRALPPVGVTSPPWPAPPHIQLSYETNPFGASASTIVRAVVGRTRSLLALQRCCRIASGHEGTISMSFSTLGLTPSVCLPLARLQYEAPTPIQSQAIPVVLTGCDVLARAQT